MIEKIGPIKNPLTIIAIFAAIAEISGTLVLPFIAAANQAVYVWFLMIFPILLITLFFLTLNFNHRVLYAPSDYKNEENFLHSLPRATYTEKALKLETEVLEEQAATAQAEKESTSTSGERPVEPSTQKMSPQVVSYEDLVARSPQARHMLAEDLIFRKLASEFSSEIQREVRVGYAGGPYIFDGIVREGPTTTVIEVKYSRQAFFPSAYLRETLSRIQKSLATFPAREIQGVRVLLAIATDEQGANQARVAEQVDRLRTEFPFAIELRFYSLAELKREANIGA